MKLRLILLFSTLTCLQASYSAECLSAIAIEEAKKKRLSFCCASLTFGEKATQATLWDVAQNSLDERIRMVCDAPLEPFYSEGCLDTTLRTAFQNIMKKINLSEASKLFELKPIAQLVLKVLVKVYTKKHPIISDGLVAKQVPEMEKKNFHLDLTLYYHSFALLEREYAFSASDVSSDDQKCQRMYYHLLSSFDGFCDNFLVRSDVHYSLWQEEILDIIEVNVERSVAKRVKRAHS
ncbi:MAG: hypothetical protein OXC30_00725 [Alphaproteobacteria bacterium]|nr:hypothetical protein [Alphaproteobacteria bacterium]